MAQSVHAAHASEAANGHTQDGTSPAAQLVRAPLQYVKPPRTGEELFVYKYELPEDVDRASNLEIDEVEVDFTDLRTGESPFDIVQSGFQLERLQVPKDIDWDDDRDVGLNMLLHQATAVVQLSLENPSWLQVEKRYYPLVEKLLMTVAGASRIHIFDHTIRKAPDR